MQSIHPANISTDKRRRKKKKKKKDMAHANQHNDTKRC
jgi:hypothetical protein